MRLNSVLAVLLFWLKQCKQLKGLSKTTQNKIGARCGTLFHVSKKSSFLIVFIDPCLDQSDESWIIILIHKVSTIFKYFQFAIWQLFI
jgi:hypothetical protein